MCSSNHWPIRSAQLPSFLHGNLSSCWNPVKISFQETISCSAWLRASNFPLLPVFDSWGIPILGGVYCLKSLTVKDRDLSVCLKFFHSRQGSYKPTGALCRSRELGRHTLTSSLSKSFLHVHKLDGWGTLSNDWWYFVIRLDNKGGLCCYPLLVLPGNTGLPPSRWSASQSASRARWRNSALSHVLWVSWNLAPGKALRKY